jgi:hypothetical protein
LWVLPRVNILLSYLLSCVVTISSLFRFGARKVRFGFWGFLALTGLTGVLHRPDLLGAFCGSSQDLLVSSSGDRSDRCCSPEWLVQVSGAQVVSSATFSSPCRWLLVPRTSSTPVSTWSWPTWVVESETCFGSRVCLVGVLISSENNFYRLPFTPLPLFGSPNRSSHRQWPLVLHLHHHQSSRNLQLQYIAKSQYTQHCQSLITSGSDHPPVLEPHKLSHIIVCFPFLLVLTCILVACFVPMSCLCINHGRLATMFMIALWSCIPILLSFVWYCGGWYIWTLCHALWLPFVVMTCCSSISFFV